MSILDSALYAARLGFHVFPLDPWTQRHVESTVRSAYK